MFVALAIGHRLPVVLIAVDLCDPERISRGLLRGVDTVGDITITTIAGLKNVQRGLCFDFDKVQQQAERCRHFSFASRALLFDRVHSATGV